MKPTTDWTIKDLVDVAQAWANLPQFPPTQAPTVFIQPDQGGHPHIACGRPLMVRDVVDMVMQYHVDQAAERLRKIKKHSGKWEQALGALKHLKVNQLYIERDPRLYTSLMIKGKAA